MDVGNVKSQITMVFQWVDTTHAHFFAMDDNDNKFTWHMTIEEYIDRGKPGEILLSVESG